MEELRLVVTEPLWHPSSVAARAKLFGVDAPAIENCSVLESDCADGGNLLSMAQSLPDATFTGVCRSEAAYGDATELAKESGLDSVRFLKESEAVDGTYDYIFLRSVYSRYALSQRQKVVNYFASRLNPGGILVVESLSRPGWDYVEPIREQMRYHTRNINDPHEKMIAGRQFLSALAQSVPDTISQYKLLAEQEWENSKSIPDINFAYEYLDKSLIPCYFHEFADSLKGNGMQYLCDLSLGSMMINQFPGVMGSIVPEDSGLVEAEQYLDFAVNRTKRVSLLCADDIEVTRQIGTDAVRDLYFSAVGLPENPESVFETEETLLQSPNGGVVSIKHTAGKAALLALASVFPRRMSFAELLEAVEKGLGSINDDDETVIGEVLAACAASEIVQIDSSAGAASYEVTDKPVVSPLARAQAALGRCGYVSSLQHRPITIDRVASELLAMLDGSHSVDDLVEKLQSMIESGDLSLKQDGEDTDDAELISEASDAQVRAFLDRFLAEGLLLG